MGRCELVKVTFTEKTSPEKKKGWEGETVTWTDIGGRVNISETALPTMTLLRSWTHSGVLHQIVNRGQYKVTSTTRINLGTVPANSFTFHHFYIMDTSSNGHKTNTAHDHKSLSTPPPTPNQNHDHGHSHSMFGVHSHERESVHGAENIMKALRGTGPSLYSSYISSDASDSTKGTEAVESLS